MCQVLIYWKILTDTTVLPILQKRKVQQAVGGQLRGSWWDVNHRATPFTPALPRLQIQRKNTPLPKAALKVHYHLSCGPPLPLRASFLTWASDSFQPFSLPFRSHPRALLATAYPSHHFLLLRPQYSASLTETSSFSLLLLQPCSLTSSSRENLSLGDPQHGDC